MNPEQIRLYAECRVACPSGMIRLRSISDAKGLAVVATRPRFSKMSASEPRVVLLRDGPIPLAEPRVERFEPETAWIKVHRSLFWDHDDRVFIASAQALAEQIIRHFRQAMLDIRL